MPGTRRLVFDKTARPSNAAHLGTILVRFSKLFVSCDVRTLLIVLIAILSLQHPATIAARDDGPDAGSAQPAAQ